MDNPYGCSQTASDAHGRTGRRWCIGIADRISQDGGGGHEDVIVDASRASFFNWELSQFVARDSVDGEAMG